MGRQDRGSGVVIETDDGGLKAMAFGWGATLLGVGIAVSAIVLSGYLGVALTIVSSGLGIAFAAVGVGEGVKRARIGDAARIQAKTRMIEARHNRELPPTWEG